MATQRNSVRTLRWVIVGFGLAAGGVLLAGGNTIIGVVLLGMGGLRLAMLMAMRRQRRSFAAAPRGAAGGPMRDTMQRLARGELEVAATTIGVESDELRRNVADGRSIAAVATAAGVPTEQVVDAVMRDAAAKIDRAVSAGNLAPDRAEMLRGRLPRWANRFVAGTGPDRSTLAT